MFITYWSLLFTIVYITGIPDDSQYLPKHEGVKNTWYKRLMCALLYVTQHLTKHTVKDKAIKKKLHSMVWTSNIVNPTLYNSVLQNYRHTLIIITLNLL